MTKKTFIATAPDGTTKTRKTENGNYPFALALHYPPHAERFDKYSGRTWPATEAYWVIASFHSTRDAAARARKFTSDRFEIVKTEVI